MGSGDIWKIALGVFFGLAGWAAYDRWQRQRAIDAFVHEWSDPSAVEVGRPSTSRVVHREVAHEPLLTRTPRAFGVNERCVGGTVIRVENERDFQQVLDAGRPVRCSGRMRL
jgi:hypothetical protein